MSNLFVLLAIFFFGGKAAAEKAVTYGSAVQLLHNASSFRLVSSKISWGAGSGQQVVTCEEKEDDHSTLWLVKAAGGESGRTAGEAVKCNDYLRLEHLQTGRNLHSHAHRALLSGNYEVSGFGEAGEGDDGDNFLVECVDASTKVWITSQKVRLRHIELKGYLHSNKKAKFSQSNCPRCPIIGHQEVSISTRRPSNDDLWHAVEGVLLTSTEADEEEEAKHDEL